MRINLISRAKKIATLLLAAAIIVSSSQMLSNKVNAVEGNRKWTDKGNYDTDWYYLHSEYNDFIISNEKELAGLSVICSGLNGNEKFNFVKKTITLRNDLNMGGYIWTPIGFRKDKFAGVFNGNKKTISQLFTDVDKDDVGLFGCNSGLIKNVEIANGKISGKSAVGGVAGTNEGTVENSYNTTDIKGTGYCVGGVAGVNYGTIENSYNTGKVEGNVYVGGVTGNNTNKGVIKNSSNTGDITGGFFVGGVAGGNKKKIENSYNTGYVKGQNYVGGVVGLNEDEGIAGLIDYISIIKNSYNTGGVEGERDVGGFFGVNRNGKAENCYYCNDEGKIKNKSNDLGQGLSGKEMKEEEFARRLGDEFASDTNFYGRLINNGFPVLNFQINKLIQRSFQKQNGLFSKHLEKIKKVSLSLKLKNEKTEKLRLLFNEICEDTITSLESDSKVYQ